MHHRLNGQSDGDDHQSHSDSRFYTSCSAIHAISIHFSLLKSYSALGWGPHGEFPHPSSAKLPLTMRLIRKIFVHTVNDRLPLTVEHRSVCQSNCYCRWRRERKWYSTVFLTTVHWQPILKSLISTPHILLRSISCAYLWVIDYRWCCKLYLQLFYMFNVYVYMDEWVIKRHFL